MTELNKHQSTPSPHVNFSQTIINSPNELVLVPAMSDISYFKKSQLEKNKSTTSTEEEFARKFNFKVTNQQQIQDQFKKLLRYGDVSDYAGLPNTNRKLTQGGGEGSTLQILSQALQKAKQNEFH
jgi:hypothetical protein